MGKLIRYDRYQVSEPENIGEQLVELQEAHGIKGPIRFIYTYLFDPAFSEIQPIYGIACDEHNRFWPQWVGPPAEELYECATIEEAVQRCQAHYDSLQSN